MSKEQEQDRAISQLLVAVADLEDRLEQTGEQLEALRKIVGKYAVTKQGKQALEDYKKLWGIGVKKPRMKVAGGKSWAEL